MALDALIIPNSLHVMLLSRPIDKESPHLSSTDKLSFLLGGDRPAFHGDDWIQKEALDIDIGLRHVQTFPYALSQITGLESLGD